MLVALESCYGGGCDDREEELNGSDDVSGDGENHAVGHGDGGGDCNCGSGGVGVDGSLITVGDGFKDGDGADVGVGG